MSAPIKPFIDLRQIHEISAVALSIIGLFPNLLLLFLILKQTGPKLKSYQKVLLQNCILDIIYNIANGITRTQLDFKDGTYFFVLTNAYGQISSPYRNLLVSLWIFALVHCITALPVQFISRYFLIVKGQTLDGIKYLLLLMIALVVAIGYASISIFSLWSTEEVYLEKRKLLEADIYFYKESPVFVTGDLRTFRFIVQLLYASALLNSSYLIVIWTSWKVWKHLKNQEDQMSPQTKDINRQITKALIMQAILPFITCLLPIGITIIMVLFNAKIDGFGILISLILSWIPLINSTTTIFVVKAYRKIVVKFVKRALCCQKSSTVATSGNLYVASNSNSANSKNINNILP